MKDKPVAWLAVFISAGACFSGYLSGVKFFTATCAFSEPCPIFLGYPACYYGFAMFGIMLILTGQFILGGITRRIFLKLITGISLLGILFAGSFTLGEIPRILSEGIAAFMLGLPTCAYGLIAYCLIFFTAMQGTYARVSQEAAHE